jgi:hypothetical protein
MVDTIDVNDSIRGVMQNTTMGSTLLAFSDRL